MNKVLNTYDQFFADPNERYAYLKREIARAGYEQAMEHNFEKCKEEGIEKANEQHALAFIKAGISRDMVFKILKMSEEKNTEFLSKYKDLKICSITYEGQKTSRHYPPSPYRTK